MVRNNGYLRAGIVIVGKTETLQEEHVTIASNSFEPRVQNSMTIFSIGKINSNGSKHFKTRAFTTS